MGSFGERMQREREMRSITLEEIAESTKISKRMLRALEEEDFEKLPGGIFNRGFVRSYTRYLGLDEEQAVLDYEKAVEEGRRRNEGGTPVQPELFPNGRSAKVVNIYAAAAARAELRPEAPVQPAAERDQAAGLLLAGVVLVVLLGVGGFGWKLWSEHAKRVEAEHLAAVRASQPRESQPAPQPSIVSAAPADQPPSAGDVPKEVTTDPKNAQSSSSSVPVNPASSNTASSNTASGNTASSNTASTNPTSEGAVSAGAASAKPGPAETGAASAAPIELQLRAAAETWAQIKIDGKTVQDGVIDPGVLRRYSGQKEVVLKLGNAEAVELSFNGQRLPGFPAGTKTKTLTFTPNGLRQ